MGSEDKPAKKPEDPQDAASGAYVPPSLNSVGPQVQGGYVPPPISYPAQQPLPQYAPPQYIPSVGIPTPSNYTAGTETPPFGTSARNPLSSFHQTHQNPNPVPNIDPMAPVGPAPPVLMSPQAAPVENYSTPYLLPEQSSAPFPESNTRTIFLPRKSNPILGFVIVGAFGMLGIVIVGLVVALAKKDEIRETPVAANTSKKQTLNQSPSKATETTSKSNIKTAAQTNPTPENPDKNSNVQNDPPTMNKGMDPPNFNRERPRNDRPNRFKGMANKNRPRPPTDEPPKSMQKNEADKMPAPNPVTDAPSTDTKAMPVPNEMEKKAVVPPVTVAKVEPAQPATVANQENRKATPEQEVEFLNVLKNIRTAIEKRDFETAKKEQTKADQLAISDDMKTMADGMSMVYQYNEIFWKLIQNSMRNLNGEIEIGSQTAFVVTSNSESMTVRMQGKNREFSFNTLPNGLAVAIAKRVMNEDPANKATLAAFYFSHPQMGKASEAKELFSAAKKGGVKTDAALFLLEKENLITAK